VKTKSPCVIHRPELVRTGYNVHTAGLDRPISQTTLGALNRVQQTAWKINTWILDVMLEAWAEGRRIGKLEVGEPLATERQRDEVWADMSDEDKARCRDKLRKRYAENRVIIGRSTAILNILEIAEELRDEPAIWYPHSMDFRGRIYPMAASGPQPQGSDVAKSLLMFAEGKPLGTSGLFWLCIRAANCFGMDKLSLEDRVGWTLANQDEIISTAQSPLTSEWWTQADEPWSFLATCHELAQAITISTPEHFVSHLPVPLDGSCNGLQHLSAMGLDPTGSRATNLTSCGERQDIYAEVAKRVALAVAQDALDGVDAAVVWDGKVERKTVKRAVMTTPYGVTARGIRDQLLNDRLVPAHPEIDVGQLADYMRDKIMAALDETVAAAREIMGWLQTVSEKLASAGIAFDWNTPTGTRIRQAYHIQLKLETRCLIGRLTTYSEERKAELNPKKQSAGSAPNFVHSFDAAHLARTVNGAYERGVRAFSMIHDSFGTHACDTTLLSAELREQFVEIYKDDWLRRTYEDVRAYAPHVDIPEPPQRGSFDIGEVRNAEFFFS
jgi:DNA-directed RNA polymerase